MRALAAALALVAGAVLLWQQQRLTAQVEALTAEVRASRAPPEQRGAAAAVVLDARERDLLVQMIAASIAPPTSAPGPSPLPSLKLAVAQKHEEPAHQPTPAQRAAAEQAALVFESALASGTLRAADVAELRRLSAQADPVAFQELRQRLALAINRDELRPADPAAGMP